MALLEINLIRRERDSEAFEEASFLYQNLETERVQKLLNYIQSQIKKADDDQLIELAVRARHAEQCAFILRGMCAFELRRRTVKRLAGGRGKKDRAKAGIQARLAELAREIQV